MSAEHTIADAFRVVAMRLEEALERGQRSKDLTADDLLETLLSIADRLDPPTGIEDQVLAAAKVLLEAREDEMITHVEWDRLEAAVAATSR